MNAKHIAFASLILVACGPLDLQQPCGGPHAVEASLSSVTLANDCGGGAKAAADSAGACLAESPCPSLCRQSSMQLAFGSQQLTPATVEIKAVRLMEPKTGKLLQTLTWREPQMWNADQYISWDQIIPAERGLKATYKLSAPGYNWASYARFGYQTYSVEVDVAIDGQLRTLQVEATREPEVAT